MQREREGKEEGKGVARAVEKRTVAPVPKVSLGLRTREVTQGSGSSRNYSASVYIRKVLAVTAVGRGVVQRGALVVSVRRKKDDYLGGFGVRNRWPGRDREERIAVAFAVARRLALSRRAGVCPVTRGWWQGCNHVGISVG